MDFSNQYKRLTRAEKHLHDLEDEIRQYASNSSWSGDAKIANDRLSWELRLNIKSQPPLDDWGLLFGEAISQLRSLLDNTLVLIAKNDAMLDSIKLKRLQFPICGNLKEWNNSKARIGILPSEYQIAIENIQPFNRVEEGGSVDQDLLIILRDLSNQDKHYIQIKPMLNQSQINHIGSIEFFSSAEAAKNVPPNVEFFNPSFKDGGVLLRQKTISQIKKVKGSYSILAPVQILLPDGRIYNLTELLGQLGYYTGLILSHINSVDSAK